MKFMDCNASVGLPGNVPAGMGGVSVASADELLTAMDAAGIERSLVWHVAQREHELADLEDLVELDVTQAHIRLEDAMVTIRSERGTVDLAREGLRLAELRFKEGAGIQSEILDAELALTTAETSLVQAIRDYAVANALLERATGKNWSRAMSTAPEDE